MRSLRSCSLTLGLVVAAACAQTQGREDAPATSGAPTASDEGTQAPAAEPELELVARSERQWTGVAVSEAGRIFVNFPRWSYDVPVSVAEVRGGELVPYPDAAWQQWQPGQEGEERFVAVQSVVIDDENRLWVLDTGNPQFRGVIVRPRLYQFDLDENRLVRSYAFPPEFSSGDSYLNDVRVDTERNVAYLTDSQAGGLVVLDLASGAARKVLRDHPSTQAEVDRLVVMGRVFERRVDSDGIALTTDGETLYWSVLTGHSLYRIPTAALRDASLDDDALASRIERVATIQATDGILFDDDGVLWLGGLEEGAIYRYVPGGAYEQVIEDPRLRWPDSLAEGPDGRIYVTTSQIHLPPDERGAYEIYRFSP